MSTSSKAKISIETGQTLTDFAKMTDSGDHQLFSLGTIWSGKSGFEPDIRPNGMVSGRNVVSPHASNDTVNIAAFTAYSKGTEHTQVATTDTITRGSGPAKAKIIAITMDCTGTLAVIPGEEGSDTTFNEIVGTAGGPPYIPVSSVAIAQVRTTVSDSTPQPITAAEIFQVVGDHTERYDFPTWETFNLGKGLNADSSAEQQSHIKLSSALDPVHTGDAYKDIYVKYYTPVFAELPRTSDFVPAEIAFSVSSTEFYNGAIASSSSALGAGAFTALLGDGITDAILTAKDQVTTVKFWPDRNKSPFILTQGGLGIGRTFPVGDQNAAAVTIAAEAASADFSS